MMADRAGRIAGGSIKRIAVFSDTHGNRGGLVSAVEQTGPFDMLIHLGDGLHDGMRVAEASGIEFCGISGNEDPWLDFPETRTLALNPWRIFMLHGHQTEINPYQEQSEFQGHVQTLCEMAKGENTDLMLFGHTHRPMLEKNYGVVICNPGEQCLGSSCAPTFAAIELHGGKMEILLLEKIVDEGWCTIKSISF